MRVAPPPAGSFSDDSDGDAGAWPLAASTSRRRDASDDADDLRQMLDAAEAARAALREVASSAAAEREMAFEARDAANAERDLLRGELEPLRASLAEATRALAQRDDETRSLRFKLDQLLRHARERDRVTTATRPSSDRIEEEEEEEEERVYIEALATLSASSELELAETRGALRDARDEVETFSSTNQSLRRERDALNEEVLVLKDETRARRGSARDVRKDARVRDECLDAPRGSRRGGGETLGSRKKRKRKSSARRDARGRTGRHFSAKRALGRRCRVCVSRRRGRGFGGASYR
jgi:chromosome segregation ATPase